MSSIPIAIIDIGDKLRIYYKAFYYYKNFHLRNTFITKVFTSRGVVNLDVRAKFYTKKVYSVPFEKWLEMSKLNVKDEETFILLITMIEAYPELKTLTN